MIDASQQPESQTVGEEFCGKWIDWNEENSQIVASGATAEQAKQNVLVVRADTGVCPALGRGVRA